MAASLWGAHLAAIAVRADAREAAPLAGEGLSGAMIEDMMDAAERDASAREAKIRAIVAAAGPGIALEVVVGREAEIIPARARLCDLAILPHPDRAGDAALSDCLHAVLFESGHPVLVAPRVPPATLGHRCCVAWNGTVESAAALTAMLPWLSRADAVRVLHAPAYQRRGPPAEDVLPYLALHGITAEAAPFAPLARDVGAGLLAAARDFGADLLGMGAYSHSRLRQLILGGVTRHVLENAEVAVLMSR